MNEREFIQYRGFRNIYDEDGKAIGFEFRVRLNYYRGVWLSQLRGGRVVVDGEVFPSDCGAVTWVFDDKEYTPQEMAQDNKHFFEMTKPVTIRVKKDGGLSQGYHDIEFRYGYSSSYMPPVMDQFDENVEFANPFFSNTQRRRMLIV